MSFLLLEYTGTSDSRAIPLLSQFLRERASRSRGTAERAIVARGIDLGAPSDDGDSEGLLAPDAIDGFVYRHRRPPGWLKGIDGLLWNETHELVVLIRRRTFIAVAGADLRSALERWVRGRERPPFRLIKEWVLESALLSGESKGLWLQGTHHRTPLKPDTKNITGVDLQQALDEFEDSSYALRSGRASLPDSPLRTALVGSVGTTPSNSVAWGGQAHSFEQFVQAACELIDLVEETDRRGQGDPTLPSLAATVANLDQVRSAYEVLLPSHQEVSGYPGATGEEIEAALALDGSIVDLIGDESSPNLTLVLGREGAEVGRVRVIFSDAGDGRVDRITGVVGTPSDPRTLAALRSSLDVIPDIRVYYQSGHNITDGKIYRHFLRVIPFRGWEFSDFSDSLVHVEKPEGAAGETEIHGCCGEPGDRSLFGWVVRRFSTGWLICDDGAGEMADFLHLDNDGTLSLIHVKAASSNTARRGISTVAYEVVVSQALKNVMYLDQDHLLGALRPTLNSPRAAWVDGTRVSGRGDFIEALEMRSPRDRARLVIVQPHVSEGRHRSAAEAGRSTPDGVRLQLLDSLLNGARATVARSTGAELVVISAR
jgi:hypothetical protein